MTASNEGLDGMKMDDLVNQDDIVVPSQPIRRESTRRSLVDNLEDIDPRVLAIAKKKARFTVDQYKRYKKATPEVRDKSLQSEKEEIRVFYREVHREIEKTKKQRRTFTEVRSTPRPKKKIGKSVNFGSVKKPIDDHIKGGVKMARPLGQQKGALSLGDDRVEALNPVLKLGAQTEQLLGHISELFMARVSDMEVETMLVNNRVFVAANTQASARAIASLNLQELLQEAAKAFVADNAASEALRRYRIGVVGQALAIIDDKTPLSREQQQGAELLGQYQFGFHTDYDARADLQNMLQFLQKQVRSRLQVQGPFSAKDAAKKLDDKAFEGQVIAILPPDDKSHAEQYLALTLVEAKYGGRAVIAGTKNPCSCCWLTLVLVLQHGYDVQFNNFAGAYWPKAARGVRLVADALGVDDVGDLMEYFRLSVNMTGTTYFKQHVTALEEVGLNVTIKVPAKDGGMNELNEMELTQDQTARSKFFVRNPEYTTESLPDSYGEVPGSPVQSYGTPLHDTQYMEEDNADKEYQENYKKWQELTKQAESQKQAKEKLRAEKEKGNPF